MQLHTLQEKNKGTGTQDNAKTETEEVSDADQKIAAKKAKRAAAKAAKNETETGKEKGKKEGETTEKKAGGEKKGLEKKNFLALDAMKEANDQIVELLEFSGTTV